MEEEKEGEEGEVEGVAGEGGDVVDLGEVEGAGLESTEGCVCACIGGGGVVHFDSGGACGCDGSMNR